MKEKKKNSITNIGITSIIPIMAFIGYMLGRENDQAVVGAFLGMMLGIFVMLGDLIFKASRSNKKKVVYPK